MLRSVPVEASQSSVARIDALLGAIAAEEQVVIPLAIESGSRAWGFPSPDSDYDCRFIYIRSIDAYLSPWPPRDVIETPLDRELDVNGWDLAKALKLMVKGNAVVIEWLQSPFVYQAEADFLASFLNLAMRLVRRDRLAAHYLHLGERQRRVYFGNDKQVPLKKLFYALRPAAALRWLRLHDAGALPPMHFPSLLDACDPGSDVRDWVERLLVAKAATRELGAAPLPPPIRQFMDEEFARARDLLPARPSPVNQAAIMEAETFFRDSIRAFGPSAR